LAKDKTGSFLGPLEKRNIFFTVAAILMAAVGLVLAVACANVAIQLCGDLLFHRDYLFRAGLIVRSVAHLDCIHVLAGADIYYEVELL